MADDLEARLRRMDGTLRPLLHLGRHLGCGMPGSVSARPLSRLLQQAVLLLPRGSTDWHFVDIGAGAGRMLLAAAMCGASTCVGLELCNLIRVFEGAVSRVVHDGLLCDDQASRCHLVKGNAKKLTSVQQLLGPVAATAADVPVVVSLIDEGMPLAVREHVYQCIAADKQVAVVLTVNYKSRHTHLQESLVQAGFRLIDQFPAPLTGGSCHTTGRVYVRCMNMVHISHLAEGRSV